MSFVVDVYNRWRLHVLVVRGHHGYLALKTINAPRKSLNFSGESFNFTRLFSILCINDALCTYSYFQLSNVPKKYCHQTCLIPCAPNVTSSPLCCLLRMHFCQLASFGNVVCCNEGLQRIDGRRYKMATFSLISPSGLHV